MDEAINSAGGRPFGASDGEYSGIEVCGDLCDPTLAERIYAHDGPTVLAATGLSTGWCATTPAGAGPRARGRLGTSGSGSGTDLRISSGLPGASATVPADRT